MHPQSHCDPEDMILFLLAFCCQDDFTETPISCDEILDRLFEDCFRTVTPVANSEGLRQRLDNQCVF